MQIFLVLFIYVYLRVDFAYHANHALALAAKQIISAR
jgi:hypothetical protein